MMQANPRSKIPLCWPSEEVNLGASVYQAESHLRTDGTLGVNLHTMVRNV